MKKIPVFASVVSTPEDPFYLSRGILIDKLKSTHAVVDSENDIYFAGNLFVTDRDCKRIENDKNSDSIVTVYKVFGGIVKGECNYFFYINELEAKKQATKCNEIITTATVDVSMYPEADLTFKTEIIHAKDNDKFVCFYNSNPNNVGIHVNGKPFFPVDTWKTCDIGPAEVTIVKDLGKYGFIDGKMINPNTSIDDLINAINKLDTSTIKASTFKNRLMKGDFIQIESPNRGTYWAIDSEGRYYISDENGALHYNYDWLVKDISDENNIKDRSSIKDCMLSSIFNYLSADTCHRLLTFKNSILSQYESKQARRKYNHEYTKGSIDYVLDDMGIDVKSNIDTVLVNAFNNKWINIDLLLNRPIISLTHRIENLSSISEDEIIILLDFIESVNVRSEKELKSMIKRGRLVIIQ